MGTRGAGRRKADPLAYALLMSVAVPSPRPSVTPSDPAHPERIEWFGVTVYVRRRSFEGGVFWRPGWGIEMFTQSKEVKKISKYYLPLLSLLSCSDLSTEARKL